MKRTISLLALVAVVGFVASLSLAADAKPATLEGTFVKVDGAKLVLTVKAVDTTVATMEKTAVTVDGKEAKLADLKAGMTLVVTLTDAKAPTAAKVEAKAAAPASAPAKNAK